MQQGFIVFGDVHGCRDQLSELLDKLSKLQRRQIIFLGDYIDRGPDSDGVLTLVRELKSICLKGNHEQSLLHHVREHGSLPAPTPENKIPHISSVNLEWLKSNLLPYYSTEAYLFVHAGLQEGVPLDRQDERDLLWSRHAGKYSTLAPKIVIHGHTVVEKVLRVGNRININTGCGFGGPLTALLLPELKVLQSKASPNSREGNVQRMRQELEVLFGKGT
jgi:serine/threonine protein phosphatase 1